MPTRFCRPRTYRWDSTRCSRFLSWRPSLAIKTFPMRGSMACCRPLSLGAHSSAMRIALLCLSRDEELEALSSQLRRIRHKGPIASHSERVFVRAKLLDPLAPKPHQSCARTNEPC
jgi:hypothetical protein